MRPLSDARAPLDQISALSPILTDSAESFPGDLDDHSLTPLDDRHRGQPGSRRDRYHWRTTNYSKKSVSTTVELLRLMMKSAMPSPLISPATKLSPFSLYDRS